MYTGSCTYQFTFFFLWFIHFFFAANNFLVWWFSDIFLASCPSSVLSRVASSRSSPTMRSLFTDPAPWSFFPVSCTGGIDKRHFQETNISDTGVFKTQSSTIHLPLWPSLFTPSLTNPQPQHMTQKKYRFLKKLLSRYSISSATIGRLVSQDSFRAWFFIIVCYVMVNSKRFTCACC